MGGEGATGSGVPRSVWGQVSRGRVSCRPRHPGSGRKQAAVCVLVNSAWQSFPPSGCRPPCPEVGRDGVRKGEER